MDRMELVAGIAEITGVIKVNIYKALDVIMKTTKPILQSVEEILLTGFGHFGTIKRETTTVRKQKTAQDLKTPERVAANFKPVEKLKDAVAR